LTARGVRREAMDALLEALPFLRVVESQGGGERLFVGEAPETSTLLEKRIEGPQVLDHRFVEARDQWQNFSRYPWSLIGSAPPLSIARKRTPSAVETT